MADEKITLPDGGWALLRDPRRVTEKQRRPVTRLQARVAGSEIGALLSKKGTLPDDEFERESLKALGSDAFTLLDDLNDALIGALVEQWSYDGEPSADAALNLPGPVYDALKTACAKNVTALMPDFTPTPEAMDNPEAPSGSSNG